ncbi:MAG: hypothetical protein IT461_13695 [Planctomycetes bacterium]|jgi:hypothetical protein|nr:hypothetical protein [Planctomycetota bacterium]
MAGNLEIDRIYDPASEAARKESLATEVRALGREISLVCIGLCMLGLLALAVAYFARFNLGVSTPGNASLVSQGGSLSVTQNRFDFTSVIIGFATTCFAATIVIFGGAIAQFKRMVPATAWMIALTAAISAASIVFLIVG